MARNRRHAHDPAAVRRAADEARERRNLSDLIGRRTRLRRGGRELVGQCVFHHERTPSLRVNDAAGAYFCFGCDAAGDVIRFVMEIEGLRFTDALRSLGAAELPVIAPAERARAVAEELREAFRRGSHRRVDLRIGVLAPDPCLRTPICMPSTPWLTAAE